MNPLDLRWFNDPTELGRNVALVALYRAAEAAKTTGCSRWEFALELERLLAEGATATQLRLLQCHDLVETAVETTRLSYSTRRFRRLKSLSLPSHSCLVLTEKGEFLAAEWLAKIARDATAQLEAPGTSSNGAAHPPFADHCVVALHSDGSALRPVWNQRSRKLFVGNQLVKWLRTPADCQVAILNAFQEEGWPLSIEDPLPPRADIPAKRRLHNAVNKLNRGLAPAIRFHGNGNGRAVCWRWLS